MHRVSSLGLLAALVVMPQAKAEDFSGFYAGVNAGSGERGRDGRKTGTQPSESPAVAAANNLPPSAAGAAKALQRSRPASLR